MHRENISAGSSKALRFDRNFTKFGGFSPFSALDCCGRGMGDGCYSGADSTAGSAYLNDNLHRVTNQVDDQAVVVLVSQNAPTGKSEWMKTDVRSRIENGSRRGIQFKHGTSQTWSLKPSTTRRNSK